MTIYESVPRRIEAMQWNGHVAPSGPPGTYSANEIVAWVNANGGEARYEAHVHGGASIKGVRAEDRPPRIAVRTINGWAYAAPGHYVVIGEATFDVRPEWSGYGDPPSLKTIRDFYPVASLSEVRINHEWREVQ